jgi:oligosaccharyltransferase complex subunit beta
MSKAKILIVSDPSASKGNDSNFVEVLREMAKASGAMIEVVQDKPTKSIALSLNGDEESLYDSVYCLKRVWGEDDWSALQVTDYVKSGGNFMMVGGVERSDVLSEFGLEGIAGVAAESSGVESYKAQWNPQHSFSTLSDADSSDNWIKIMTSSSPLRTAYKLKNDGNLESFNPLIQSALSFAPGSGICRGEVCLSGTFGVSLMASLESRRGSRFLAVSDGRLFSALTRSQLEGLCGWLQGERFSNQIASFTHRLSGPGPANRGITELSSTIYRIRDEIDVRMCLTSPPTGDPSDFQIELKMMNIQVRKSFDSIASDDPTCLVMREPLQLPPKAAVYTLQVNHNRPGWSQLQHSERILLRPFRHDEFARFLPVAGPYCASWLGLLVATMFILLPRLFKANNK